MRTPILTTLVPLEYRPPRTLRLPLIRELFGRCNPVVAMCHPMGFLDQWEVSSLIITHSCGSLSLAICHRFPDKGIVSNTSIFFI